MYFKGIIALVISRLLFDIIFMQLRKSNPEILSIFDKVPERWKGKWYIEWAFILVLILVLSILEVYAGLNIIVGYVIAGFILGISSLIFKKPESQNKSQKKSKNKTQVKNKSQKKKGKKK